MSDNSNYLATQKKDSMIEKSRRFLFGDDIFISYSRVNSTYALALANELMKRNLSCFLDQWGTPPGKELPKELLDTIRRCSTMVLVGSKHAAESENVGKEVREFLETKRPIIPITFVDEKLLDNTSENFNPQNLIGTLEQAEWYPLISGIAKTTEVLSALKTRTPSENVISRIVNAIDFRTQRKRLSNTLLTSIGLFIILLLLGGLLALFALSKTNELTKTEEKLTNINVSLVEKENQLVNANNQLKNVDNQLVSINNQLANANTELENKENQLINSNIALKTAQTKINQAETQLTQTKQDLTTAQIETKRQTNLAMKAEDDRKDADKKANTQKSIAEATRLSSESTELLAQNNPQLLKEILEKSVIATQLMESNQLFLSDPIFTLRKVLAVTPQIIGKDTISLKSDWCQQSAFSVNQSAFACRSNNQVTVFQLSTPQNPSAIFAIDDLIADENEILDLSVSDNGSKIAVATRKCEKDENLPPNICINKYKVIVKDLQNKAFVQEIHEPAKIYLNPQGNKLVSSEISKGKFGESEHFLKIWDIEQKEQQILNQEKALVKTPSPDSIQPTIYDKAPYIGNFSPNGDYFAAIGKHSADDSVTVVYKYLVNDKVQNYTAIVNIINVGYEREKGGIAVNDSGDLIALKSNGISLWSLSSYPKLEALISSEIGYYHSIQFTYDPYLSGGSLSIVNNNQGLITKENWSTTGEKFSKVCLECEREMNNNPYSVFGLSLGYTPTGFLSDKDYQELTGDVDNTIITILRESDSAVIDKIDTEEKILDYAFSENGTELLTKTRKEKRIKDILYEQIYGDKDVIYRKWKIGLGVLNSLVDKRFQ